MKNKYRIIQIKTCQGYKSDFFSSSTNDINIAYQRIAKIQDRIEKTGKHTAGPYGLCSGYTNGYGGVKCKGKFVVRETVSDNEKKINESEILLDSINKLEALAAKPKKEKYGKTVVLKDGTIVREILPDKIINTKKKNKFKEEIPF